MVFCSCELTSAQVLLVSLHVGFDLSELLQQLVVLQNLDVLHMVISLVVASELLFWLSRVDSLQDAQASEVVQTHLKRADGI